MSKYRVVICAGALAACVIYCVSSRNADGKLTNIEMALIRGAAPPSGGCKAYRTAECYPDHSDMESTCQACLAASQATRADENFYPDPGNCAASGEAYGNQYSFSCDLSAEPNGLICPNGQSFKCKWDVLCTSSDVVRDMTCGLPEGEYVDIPSLRQCNVSAPPVILPGSNGNLVTRTTCRLCSTGADNGQETTAAFNLCKEPLPEQP